MRALCTKDEYKFYKNQVDSLIWTEKRLPDQVFKAAFQSFAFLHFEDVLYESLFIESLQTFLLQIGEKELSFVVIQPDPENFFNHHFEGFPALRLKAGEGKDEYFGIFDEKFSKDSLDSIELVASIGLLFSQSSYWAIYADRDFEVAIAAFRTKEMADIFANMYRPQKLLSVNQAIDEIVKNVYCHNEQENLSSIYARLTANYPRTTAS